MAFNGGANYITMVRNLIPNTDFYKQSATPLLYPVTLSLKLLKNHNKWQYGLSIDKSEAEYKHGTRYMEFNTTSGIGNGVLPIWIEVDIVSKSCVEK